MNRVPWWIGPLAAILTTFVAVPVAVWAMSGIRAPVGFYEWPVEGDSPFVRIVAGNGGEGSGVHIGDGLILTAAHVVGSSKATQVFADDGRVADGDAKILWSNAEFDIALVRAPKAKLKAAALDCDGNFTGQAVRSYGNPMGVSFVYTSGTVAGVSRQFGPWASVVPIDGTVVYGQSGGGVIDAKGRVVGIAVGLLPTPYGIAAFGFAVPAKPSAASWGEHEAPIHLQA